jgi:hypothetical protein
VADPSEAARQGDEGAPDSWLVFDADVRPALDGLKPGDDIDVLTWLYLADRTVLRVHPRGDATRPMRGVFATRSQHRPNGLLFARAPVSSTRRAHGHGLDLIVCDVDGGGGAAPRRAVAKVLCTRNADPGGPAGYTLVVEKASLRALFDEMLRDFTVVKCPGSILTPALAP